jgi:hypothetical protein
MSITIVMHQGQTLHLQDASAAQLKELRDNLKGGRGSFEFTSEDRVYIINCASVSYVEVTPASAVRP